MGADFYAGPGYGFGLGFAVRQQLGVSAVPGSPGDYQWFGSAGTNFWVDPREELIAIILAQSPAVRAEYPRRFRALVYGAIAE